MGIIHFVEVSPQRRLSEHKGDSRQAAGKDEADGGGGGGGGDADGGRAGAVPGGAGAGMYAVAGLVCVAASARGFLGSGG